MLKTYVLLESAVEQALKCSNVAHPSAQRLEHPPSESRRERARTRGSMSEWSTSSYAQMGEGVRCGLATRCAAALERRPCVAWPPAQRARRA